MFCVCAICYIVSCSILLSVLELLFVCCYCLFYIQHFGSRIILLRSISLWYVVLCVFFSVNAMCCDYVTKEWTAKSKNIVFILLFWWHFFLCWRGMFVHIPFPFLVARIRFVIIVSALCTLSSFFYSVSTTSYFDCNGMGVLFVKTTINKLSLYCASEHQQ